jgi:membrane protease YdiL (CAAX protease family)
MTSQASPAAWAATRGSGPAAAAVRRAARITLVLGLAVAARWAATVTDLADGIVVGASFGPVLAVAALLSGWRPSKPHGRRLVSEAAVGLAGGMALLALALATRWPGPWLPFDPAPSFVPWAAVTILVATAEEVVLRGALFGALADAAGWIAALLGTSVLFALLHVPLYGWHVVPLDLGVGLLLGGLRLLTGGTAAPAVAHVVADLATWWI